MAFIACKPMWSIQPRCMCSVLSSRNCIEKQEVRHLALSLVQQSKKDVKSKKYTKKVKFTTQQIMDLRDFKRDSDFLLGPPLKYKNKNKQVNDTKISKQLDALEDGEYFNQPFFVNGFEPFPETKNIIKGKPLPVFQTKLRYQMSKYSQKPSCDQKEKESQTEVENISDHCLEASENDVSATSQMSSFKRNEKVKESPKKAGSMTYNFPEKNENDMSESFQYNSVYEKNAETNKDSSETSAMDLFTTISQTDINSHDPSAGYVNRDTLSSKHIHTAARSSLKSLMSYPLLKEEGTWTGDTSFEQVLQPYISGLSRKPSVGNILRETMSEKSKAALALWEKKKIEELGKEGFYQYKQALFRKGGNFHECVEAQLLNKPAVALLPENEPTWESIKHLFTDIEDVQLVEQRVTHQKLGYTGILDSVARYRGDVVLIDWKTADRRKNTLDAAYDDPVQVLAYMGSVNDDPTFKTQLNHGLLVVAYRDGHPADVLQIPVDLCRVYWKQWLTRLHKYWQDKLNDSTSSNSAHSENV